MLPYKFYIQQLKYDGSTYEKGDFVETYTQWGVVCKEFAFAYLPEPKSIVTRDWPGEDGLEVYVPERPRAKEYDVDAEFIIKGNDSDDDATATSAMITNIKGFIDFLYGKNWEESEEDASDESDDDSGTGGVRLAIYDTYTQTGRKDVLVKKISTDAFEVQSGGNSAVIVLKIQFTVYDPATEVTLETTAGGVVTGLTW